MKGLENPTRRTWVVDHARDLAELERRLNELDREKFRIHSLYQVLVGMEPAFVIVAYLRWRRFASWLVLVATAAAFVALCFLARLLDLP